MNAKMIIRNGVAGMAVLAFVALLLAIVTQYVRRHVALTLALSAVLGLLGLALVSLTIQLKDSGWRRVWLIVMGSAAAGIPLCIVLHNVIYGLMVKMCGEDVWGPGGDEPVFFVLAVLVFPAVFVIAAIGSAVTLWRNPRRRARSRICRR